MKRSVQLLSLLGLACAAGCTSGQVAKLPSVSGPPQFTLQLAVGTATIAKSASSVVTGFNVVSTFRQPGGQNATLSNTPTLSGPASFNGSNSITGITLQQLQQDVTAIGEGLQPPYLGAFGTAIGVYGYGLAPLNLDPGSETATLRGGGTCIGLSFANSDTVTYSYLPLPLDFGSQCLTVPGQFAYYGGPPAWPSPQGYGIPNGFIGYPLGFTDFDDVTPVAGTYSLNVAYASNSADTQYTNVKASATLSSAVPLPSFATPVVTPQDDGSALIQFTVPAGVTEAIVLVTTTACLKNPSTGTALPDRHFALVTHQTGYQTLTLSSKLAPPDSSGNPTDTFCTAADDAQPNSVGAHSYSVAAAGFDYPAFEASYPQSTVTNPTIANSTGQADVTTAYPNVLVSYRLPPS